MLNWFKKEKQKLHRDYNGEEFNMQRLDEHFRDLERDIELTGYTNFWEEMQAQHLLVRNDQEPYLRQPFPQLLWLAVTHIGDYPEGFMKDKIHRSMFTREIQRFLDDNYRGEKTDEYDDKGYAARFVFNDMRDDLYHIISRHEMRDLNKTLDELAEQTKGAKASDKDVTAVYAEGTLSDEAKQKVMEEWKKEPLQLTPVSVPKVELTGEAAIKIITDLYNTAVTLGVPDIEKLCVKDFLLLLESKEQTVLTEAVRHMACPNPIIADTITGTMDPLPVPGLKEHTPDLNNMQVNELKSELGERMEVKESGAAQNYVEEAFELVPYPVIGAIASTMKEGLEKYGYQNYYGIPMEEHMGRAIRHMFKHLSGDTSENHLGHAITRLGFAIEMKDIAEKNGGYELFAHLKGKGTLNVLSELDLNFDDVTPAQKATFETLKKDLEELAKPFVPQAGEVTNVSLKVFIESDGNLRVEKEFQKADELKVTQELSKKHPTYDLNNPDDMQKMRNQLVKSNNNRV